MLMENCIQENKEKEFVTLSNDYKIPNICYGTDIVSKDFFSDNVCYQKVKRLFLPMKDLAKLILKKGTRQYKKDKGIIKCTNHAVENKCYFFDTSRAYGGSEKMLSQALKKYDRKNYYICTKLPNYDQLNGISARDSLMKSMDELGVNYVDLYLIHWPVEETYLKYWKELEGLYREGLVKAIGVSNCKIHHLEEIKKVARIMPMVDEVELHPLLTEQKLRKYCKKNGIQLMAYTSTARLDFRLKASKRMQNICRKYKKTLSQIILKWHIQNGIIPIFNTSTIDHFKNNMDIFDFTLEDDDMQIIESMNINSRTRYDSDNCEWDRL